MAQTWILRPEKEKLRKPSKCLSLFGEPLHSGRIFNTSVKLVFFYMDQKQTFITQTFINRCLRIILSIRCPEKISNTSLWNKTNQQPIEIEDEMGRTDFKKKLQQCFWLEPTRTSKEGMAKKYMAYFTLNRIEKKIGENQKQRLRTERDLEVALCPPWMKRLS